MQIKGHEKAPRVAILLLQGCSTMYQMQSSRHGQLSGKSVCQQVRALVEQILLILMLYKRSKR